MLGDFIRIEPCFQVMLAGLHGCLAPAKLHVVKRELPRPPESAMVPQSAVLERVHAVKGALALLVRDKTGYYIQHAGNHHAYIVHFLNNSTKSCIVYG